jgi:hypothetical protein
MELDATLPCGLWPGTVGAAPSLAPATMPASPPRDRLCIVRGAHFAAHTEQACQKMSLNRSLTR